MPRVTKKAEAEPQIDLPEPPKAAPFISHGVATENFFTVFNQNTLRFKAKQIVTADAGFRRFIEDHNLPVEFKK